jgi:hypothetical protein
LRNRSGTPDFTTVMSYTMAAEALIRMGAWLPGR